VGIVIGGLGLGLLAALVFLAPMPRALAVVAALGATFAAGFAVAGWLPGAKGTVGGPPVRERALARRR
jgi:hypothetical protein